jgi:DNA-binding LytR/AlgR family response regulator
MSYRCLIVDDEPLARDLLIQYVGQLPSLSLVDSCADALTGLRVLHTERVDILFTDIKMPQLTGIQLVKALNHPPKVILTTAFSDYALEGFEIGAVDYLVKPFSFERFLRAVDRALDRGQASSTETDTYVKFRPAAPTFLFLKVDKQVLKVILADVLYWQAYGNFVKVFMQNGRVLVATETLTHLMSLLPTDQFVRVHKSYIVAIAEITSYQATTLCMGSTAIPIGDLYRKQFLETVK